MKRGVLCISLAASLLLGIVAFSSSAGAVDIYGPCANGASDTVCKASGEANVGELVKNIINILLMIAGIIAVIMIIIGGIRYATSNGDSNSVTAAKNTIMYAVVGLVIAIFAYAIVNFVLTQITT